MCISRQKGVLSCILGVRHVFKMPHRYPIHRLVHRLREQLAHRMKFLPIRRLATTIVQLGVAAAIFIFYSKNIVSATVRAVLAGSV
jgi:hypothetical protein